MLAPATRREQQQHGHRKRPPAEIRQEQRYVVAAVRGPPRTARRTRLRIRRNLGLNLRRRENDVTALRHANHRVLTRPPSRRQPFALSAGRPRRETAVDFGRLRRQD